MTLTFGNLPVPWNASWTGEAFYEVRPCRWAEGKPAMWQPHNPGIGRPVFAKPHFVRQRRSVAKMLCTVCGNPTSSRDRWWFGHGEFIERHFMTTEAPVHLECAKLSLKLCPHLRNHPTAVRDLSRFPPGYSIMMSMVGGPVTEKDFGIRLGSVQIVGALKFAWPESVVHVRRPEHAA